MTIDQNTLLFFDSACLIAAAGSPSGGSGFLLLLCARGYLKAAVSQPVLLEAQKNTQLKLGEESIRRFYNLLALVPFSMAALPDKAEIARLELLTNKKDVHVLAAAIEAQALFLINLDRQFALEVNQARLGIQALSPGEFIKNELPNHVNYPAIRD